MNSEDRHDKIQEQEAVNELDVSRKDFLELELPGKNRKVVITITRRHYFDSQKNKIVTDQTLHRAVYKTGSSSNKGTGKKV